MKRAAILVLAACLAASLVGCGSEVKYKETSQGSRVPEQSENKPVDEKTNTGEQGIDVGELNGKTSGVVQKDTVEKVELTKDNAISELNKSMDSLGKSLESTEQQLNFDETTLK